MVEKKDAEEDKSTRTKRSRAMKHEPSRRLLHQKMENGHAAHTAFCSLGRTWVECIASWMDILRIRAMPADLHAFDVPWDNLLERSPGLRLWMTFILAGDSHRKDYLSVCPRSCLQGFLVGVTEAMNELEEDVFEVEGSNEAVVSFDHAPALYN